MSPPSYYRIVVRVVIFVIVLWHIHIIPFAEVSFIFLVESIGCIFKVSGDEELPSAVSHYDAYSAFLRFSDERESFVFQYIRFSNFCMSAVWHKACAAQHIYNVLVMCDFAQSKIFVISFQ